MAGTDTLQKQSGMSAKRLSWSSVVTSSSPNIPIQRQIEPAIAGGVVAAVRVMMSD